MTDPAFPCNVDRISGPLNTDDHLYMLNHNLNQELLGIDDVLIPVKSEAGTTNGVTSYVLLIRLSWSCLLMTSVDIITE